MSRWAKILWLICGLSVVFLVATRYVLGGWIDLLYIPLVSFGVTFILALVIDFKFYLEFLTMRTTKHGMNMGAMILLVLAMLVAVNFLSVRYNKTADFTEEKMHSLADSSLGVLNGLKDNLEIKIFYRGEKDKQQKFQVKATLDRYVENSDKIKIRFLNAYVETALAQEYLSRGDLLSVFVEYGDRKVKVEEPFAEEQFTNAMVKATRSSNKKVYFLKGHGERDLESDDEADIKEFKTALENSSFKVGTLNLLSGDKIPEDAAVIAIVGPRTQIQEGEIVALLDYAKKNGKLFIAADPGFSHRINILTEKLGVNYKDNFILNDRIQLQGYGQASALGMAYSKDHDITKKISGQEIFSLFDIASEVAKMEKPPEGLTLTELVKTHFSSFSAEKIMQGKAMGKRRPHIIAVAVTGDLVKAAPPKEGEVSDAFRAVIFGDSDFLSKKDILQGINKDIALNTIAYLAQEKDLISIRPKKPKGTELNMTSVTQRTVVGAGVLVPMFFIVLSGFFWYRRRNA